MTGEAREVTSGGLAERDDDPLRRRAPPGGLGAALRDGARLVLPVECPGCGRWDVVLGAPCATALDGGPWRCEDDAPRLDRMDGEPPLPVWAVAPYAGAVRGIVRCWKDEGRAALSGDLSVPAVHLVPIGGPARPLTLIAGTTGLASGRTERALYIVDEEGVLLVRQGNQWRPVAEGVRNPVFPG